jgi:hypothetical protein
MTLFLRRAFIFCNINLFDTLLNVLVPSYTSSKKILVCKVGILKCCRIRNIRFPFFNARNLVCSCFKDTSKNNCDAGTKCISIINLTLGIFFFHITAWKFIYHQLRSIIHFYTCKRVACKCVRVRISKLD